MSELPSFYAILPEIKRALDLGLAVVALESAVITHGLPYPENQTLAEDMEDEIRRLTAVPATIAVIEGKIRVGLTASNLLTLAESSSKLRKLSSRDLGAAVVQGASGGTTVAGTMAVASQVGISVFATGGIGGVHHDITRSRKGSLDISADLIMLANTPMIVVCAGAKAILDLAATVEYLETACVPVVGYQTDDFPAFYTRKSGLKTAARANSPEEVARLARAHWALGQRSAVLVVVPPPEEYAMPQAEVEEAVRKALAEAQEQGIRGQTVTPFLLERVNQQTHGASMAANLALLLNNARLAGQIAGAMAVPPTAG
jgi:pseudouridine-5'-phosphate glycosidase